MKNNFLKEVSKAVEELEIQVSSQEITNDLDKIFNDSKLEGFKESMDSLSVIFGKSEKGMEVFLAELAATCKNMVEKFMEKRGKLQEEDHDNKGYFTGKILFWNTIIKMVKDESSRMAAVELNK